MDNVPYYVQQLSEEVWNRTDAACEDSAVEQAYESILNAQGELYRSFTRLLSISQQNLLHALAKGEKELTSGRVMEAYGLKNSLTVLRAKKALLDLDVIDDFGKEITFEDPVYEMWLRQIYFA